MTPRQAQTLAQQEALIDLKRHHGLAFTSGANRQTKTINLIKALARRDGYQVSVAIAESMNPHSGHKKDLFGIIDLVAIEPTLTRGIQVCGSDWQPHIRKLQDEGMVACTRWLASPYRTLELWGWRKVAMINKDGKKQSRQIWMPKLQLITLPFLAGLEDAVLSDPFAVK